MPVIFNRAGNIFDVYHGNDTFRVNHKGVDILNFRVNDDAPVDPDPVDPEPVDPEPVDPEPVPVDPAPVDPSPVPTPAPPPATPPIVGAKTATDGPSLIALAASVNDGDTIALKNAQYGVVNIPTVKPNVRFVVENTHGAHFERLFLQQCNQLDIHGITGHAIAPVPKDAKGNPKNSEFVVWGNTNAKGVKVYDALFMGRSDAEDHHNWGRSDWRDFALGGVHLRGDGGVVARTRMVGVRFGLAMYGPNADISDIHVDGFSGDAYRVANNGHRYKRIACNDNVLVDGNHGDAIQGYSPNGIHDLMVEEFVFLEWMRRSDNPLRFDPTHKRPGVMQGVGMHDTPYTNHVYRRGIIRTATWNGVNLQSPSFVMEDVHAWNGDRGLGLSTPLATVRINAGGLGSLKNCTAEAFTAMTDPTCGPHDPNFVFPDWAKAMGYAG